MKADHFVAEGWIFVSINHRLVAEDNGVPVERLLEAMNAGRGNAEP